MFLETQLLFVVWFFMFHCDFLIISKDQQDWEEMAAPGYMPHYP